MADYYSIIANAVSALDWNTRDARRQLYERARTALITQMRGTTPALDQSDILAARISLEEAIGRVEAEARRDCNANQPTDAPETFVPHGRVVATGQGHENWISELLTRASSEERG
jgi:hypothetical protein